MYPPLCFCLGDTLHAMYTAFVFEYSIHARTADLANNFFKTSGGSFGHTGNLHFPAFLLNKPTVHTKEVPCKNGGFVSSGSCTYLHYGVLAVLWICRNK